MKILFNLCKCGLGNNGGSQTIIRMASALHVLGHDVRILLDMPNRFTWFPVERDILTFVDTDPNTWPKGDVIIATGCSTVTGTMAYSKLPLEKKFYWIRGFETWAQSEEILKGGYALGMNLLVNSEWQKRNIWRTTGHKAQIQYSGLPIDEIYAHLNIDFKRSRLPLDHVNIGALYSKRDIKKFNVVLDVIRGLGHRVREFKTFGNDSTSGDNNLMNFFPRFCLPSNVIQPSFKHKISLMQSCDIWLSTSVNDGLHIPPMEAGLCGCNLVAMDMERSGVRDYAINDLTALTFLNVDEACEAVKQYCRDSGLRESHRANLQYTLVEKIGSVEKNAKRFEKILCQV